MKNIEFPTKKELADATMIYMKDKDTCVTTKEINCGVAKLLNLKEEILMLEDESGIGTAYEYRMRWVRTELKKRGLLLNPKRGEWTIVK